jgi:hypothetical protein
VEELASAQLLDFTIANAPERLAQTGIAGTTRSSASKAREGAGAGQGVSRRRILSRRRNSSLRLGLVNRKLPGKIFMYYNSLLI